MSDYSQNHVGLDPDDMPFVPEDMPAMDKTLRQMLDDGISHVSARIPSPDSFFDGYATGGNTSCANDPGPPRSSLSAVCGFCFRPGTEVELTWGCLVFCSEDRHRPGWRCAPCKREDLSRHQVPTVVVD